MKKFLFVVGLIVWSTTIYAQPKDELAVRKVLNDQTDAWNKGQLEIFMKDYWQSDSLKFIGKSGITYGWNETLKNYIKRYPDTIAMGKLAFKIIDIKQLSSLYIFVIGNWQLTRTSGDLSGYFTLLFKKIGNKWLIITDHSS